MNIKKIMFIIGSLFTTTVNANYIVLIKGNIGGVLFNGMPNTDSNEKPIEPTIPEVNNFEWSKYLATKKCFKTKKFDYYDDKSPLEKKPIIICNKSSFILDESNFNYPKDIMGIKELSELFLINGNIKNLWFLKNIKKIDNNITIISTNLKSLKGLDDVEEIGDLFLSGNKEFYDLSSLSKLKKVRSLDITGSSKLVDLTGLLSLTNVEKNFSIPSLSGRSINGLNNLETVGGNFTIGYNSSVGTNINELKKLKKIGGDLTVYGKNILMFGGLSNLESVGGKIIMDSKARIISFPGEDTAWCKNGIYKKFSKVTPVAIKNRASLLCGDPNFYKEPVVDKKPSEWVTYMSKNCTGFNELKLSETSKIICHTKTINQSSADFPKVPFETSKLELLDFNNGVIDNLMFLRKVTTIGGFKINGTTLYNFKGLSSLSSVGSLSIYENPYMTSIDGFDALRSSGQVQIMKMLKLTSLKGLNKLFFINGNLFLSELPLLKSLNGLIKLVRVAGNITITKTALTNLSGFNHLTTVNGNIVISSINLKDLRGLGALKTLTGKISIATKVKIDDIIVPKKGSSFCINNMFEKMNESPIEGRITSPKLIKEKSKNECL